MAAGAVLGAFLGERVSIVEPVGDVFIRLLIMAAVPLVFFNLLAGLTTLTDLRTFGRLASRILVFFVLTTVLALVLGLVAMALVRPGDGVVLRESVDREVGAAPSVLEILTDLVPTNIFAAFAASRSSWSCRCCWGSPRSCCRKARATDCGPPSRT